MRAFTIRTREGVGLKPQLSSAQIFVLNSILHVFVCRRAFVDGNFQNTFLISDW